MLASALPSLAALPKAVLSSSQGHKWLLPLMVFLGLTGLILIVAGAVEALAPFVYAIF
jgi:hypothetical protein